MKPKTAVLIPTRGDRSEFLRNALKLLKRQTIKPDLIEVVNDPPLSSEKDITYRYRIGAERLIKKGAEVIIFWEDDDFYTPDYIELMLQKWDELGRPGLLGLGSTVYYHVKKRKCRVMTHPGRASAMSTLVTAKALAGYKWPADSEPFLDLHLWKNIPGKTFAPKRLLALGIKHGVGLTGGNGHKEDGINYNLDDESLSFLKSVIDPKALPFYLSLTSRA